MKTISRLSGFNLVVVSLWIFVCPVMTRVVVLGWWMGGLRMPNGDAGGDLFGVIGVDS